MQLRVLCPFLGYGSHARWQPIAAALCCGLLPALQAAAECSRPIRVPLSETGLSVIIDKGRVSGIYPELLRSLNGKEGCEFIFSAVPRARQEALFQAGQADLLIPATRTPLRDKAGVFIPLISNRALLISLNKDRAAIASVQDLLARHELKVTVVRGYDYGDTYQALIKELQKQGRLMLEADPASVVHTLKAKGADLTIMAPTIFAGAVQTDARLRDLAETLRFEAVPELPWGQSGAYISKTALSGKDSATLYELLAHTAKSGSVWKSYQQYYAPDVLRDGIRGLKE